MKYRIILEGFETQAELLEFAEWYVNSEKETFEFTGGGYPAAVNAYENKPIDIIDGTIIIPIEKCFEEYPEEPI